MGFQDRSTNEELAKEHSEAIKWLSAKLGRPVDVVTIPLALSSIQLTENGYTAEFEAEVLKTAEEDYAAIKDGTAGPYNSTAEMFAEWDKEDDD